MTGSRGARSCCRWDRGGRRALPRDAPARVGPRRGLGFFPDLAARRRRALEINDNIVQGLLAARELYAVGEVEDARVAAERSLEQAQRMMGDLLDESGGTELRPGDLRRAAAAGERRE